MLINAFEFAKQSLEIHDKIRPLCIPDLKDWLHADASEQAFIAYSLHGGRDGNGRLCLRLTINGSLELVCQRCLAPLQHELSADSRFVLVSGEAEVPEDDADDALDYLVATDELDIEALLREEILLAMPLAPKHEIGPCAGTLERRETGKQNPFKVLQGLKGENPE